MVLDQADCRILFGKIMHHRFIPRENKFLYSMFYLHLNADALNHKTGNGMLGINKPAILSVYAKDHGQSDQPLSEWVRYVLAIAHVPNADDLIISLITLPRVFGFVFNPVSFWMCRDNQNHLRAVICEVNNTFGERHTYVCVNENGEPITAQTEIFAQKLFHVSPFLEREGHYQFKFSYQDDKFAALIDYYNQDDQKQLATSIVGKMDQITTGRLVKAILSYPLATIQVVFLIHWQAIKIFFKGISYVPKPIQHKDNITHSRSEKLRGS